MCERIAKWFQIWNESESENENGSESESDKEKARECACQACIGERERARRGRCVEEDKRVWERGVDSLGLGEGSSGVRYARLLAPHFFC